MSGIGGWLGGGAAIIVAGLCFLLMRYTHHLPGMTHPWLHRLAIVGMYCAGVVLAVTTAGAWLIRLGRTAGGLVGGTAPGSGIGWALVTLGALFLAAALVVALIWMPNPLFAYVAVITPLVLALSPGGFAHHVYDVTANPAQSIVSQVATWAGG